MPGLLLILHAAAGGALPSTIFGDLRLGEKYLPGVEVTLACGADSVSGKTDAAGSFRLTVKTGGKCRLTVQYEKESAAIDVVAFEQPARYRLVLELKDGKYTLKRV